MPYKSWLILGGTVAFILLSLTAVEAKIVTQTRVYRQDGAVIRGFLAYDDGLKGKRHGVLVVHAWWGLNDFAREWAVKLMGLGYVALAAEHHICWIELYGVKQDNQVINLGRALLYNTVSALATLPWALLGYYFLAHMMHGVPYILLVGAASFLYIALVDLTPYLHRRFGLADSLLQLGLILAGIDTIWRLHLPRY